MLWPRGVKSHCFLLSTSQAPLTRQSYAPESTLSALLLSSPPFVEAGMLTFLFHFKITVSDAVHGGSRMCNKTTLDDLGWTDFCDSIKNSWGTRGMYCQRDQSATLSFPFQVDQRFCDGAAVSSGSFQFMTLLIKTLQPEEKETLRVAGSVLKLFIPYHEQWVSLGKANLCITYSWSQLWKASFFLL